MRKFTYILFCLFVLLSLSSCDDIITNHQHQYIDGVCECGKKEPNINLDHVHDFVDGKCRCGEEQGIVEEIYSQGLEYKLSEDETYYILTGIGSCTDVNLNISPVYQDKSVEIIQDHAFFENYSLISVNIPKSIKAIGESSFYNCGHLVTVTFEEDSRLEVINRDAFESCHELTNIIIPKSVKMIKGFAFSYSGLKNVTFEEDSKLELIDYSAFKMCTNLEKIVIPEGVTTIKDDAFWRCESLKSVVLPKSLVEIGYSAFEDCYELASIVIPENVSVISAAMFRNCSSLKSVTFNNGNNITFIEGGAFYCTSLENVYFHGTIEDWCNINIDSNPMEYAENFYLVDNNISYEVTEIVVPESISKIGNNQFFGFSDVTSISLPNTIESIGDYAFACCYSLKNIEIPNGVTSIGEFTFANYLYSYSESDDDEYIDIKSNQITDIVIPSSVKSIGKNAFAFCTNLKTVIFEENNLIEIFSEEIFVYCTSLESINIPFGVKRISEEAFACCYSLTNIIVPDSVTEMYRGGFLNCSSLQSISLPFIGSGYSKYSSKHFGYIFGAPNYDDNYERVPKSLEEVIITKTTEIGDCAFDGCYYIKTFVLPDNLTTIGSYAFSGCNIKEISIPNSVTTIGDYVFSACHSLTYIVIPSSVESIGKCIFNSMSVTFSLDIFIDLSSIPDTWNSEWNDDNYPIYLQGEWEYNDEGIPTPINS